MRGSTILLLAASLLLAGCPDTSGLFDFDGDGHQDSLDCAPEDPAINPTADDPYGDGIDSNCDGVDGEDGDGDGYPGNATSDPSVWDCNEGDVGVHPGADDPHGDGIDTDCDFRDGVDGDGDEYPGNADPSHPDHDCDDTDPEVNPEVLEAVCDTIDNDCDEETLDAPDGDGDGVTLCGEDGAEGTADDDCDEDDATVYPGADELCDQVDNDCDGALGGDEVDDDGDGVTECDNDCDDDEATVYPSAPELCDSLDNDCLDGPEADEVDGDGDGWLACAECDDTASTLNLDDADGDGWTTCEGDCDDGDADLNLDDADSDAFTTCEGDCDDGDAAFQVADADGDGVTTCGPDGLPNTADDDCDDAEATVFPGGEELCDGLDNDCDGSVAADEGVDVDGDGADLCADCDDGDASTYPGAAEVCDGVDNDCDGSPERAVPLAYATIQAAIDAAVTGDLVCVDPGTYVENIDFVGKEVHVLGIGGPEVTVIDGGGLDSVVVFDDGEGPGAVLEGFTITGGSGSWDGGGIDVVSSTPTLTGLMLTGNTTSHYGGGLSLVWSDADVENVWIVGNTANQAGGLHVKESSATLSNLWISDNHGTYAGGLRDTGGDSVYENLVVVGNSATTAAGGLYGEGTSSTFANVTFVANEAPLGAALNFGGPSFSTASFQGAVVANNLASNDGGGIAVWDTSTLTLADCNFWGNTPQNFLDDNASGWDPTGSNGNTSLDPEFLDTSGADPADWDLHLSFTSPLIDAGDPTVLDPDGSTSDVGAFGGPGAGGFDLDGDGAPLWWQPGPYDVASYPVLGWDCDDLDAAFGPTFGCDDADGDGWSLADGDCDDGDASLNLDDADGDGDTTCGGDCDDAEPTVGDGFPELCDDLDNDCDGFLGADELDGDGDGETPCDGDCDDTDLAVSTGASEQTCDECLDGIDNDCSGDADADAATCGGLGWCLVAEVSLAGSITGFSCPSSLAAGWTEGANLGGRSCLRTIGGAHMFLRWLDVAEAAGRVLDGASSPSRIRATADLWTGVRDASFGNTVWGGWASAYDGSCQVVGQAAALTVYDAYFGGQQMMLLKTTAPGEGSLNTLTDAPTTIQNPSSWDTVTIDYDEDTNEVLFYASSGNATSADLTGTPGTASGPWPRGWVSLSSDAEVCWSDFTVETYFP